MLPWTLLRPQFADRQTDNKANKDSVEDGAQDRNLTTRKEDYSTTMEGIGRAQISIEESLVLVGPSSFFFFARPPPEAPRVESSLFLLSFSHLSLLGDANHPSIPSYIHPSVIFIHPFIVLLSMLHTYGITTSRVLGGLVLRYLSMCYFGYEIF